MTLEAIGSTPGTPISVIGFILANTSYISPSSPSISVQVTKLKLAPGIPLTFSGATGATTSMSGVPVHMLSK